MDEKDKNQPRRSARTNKGAVPKRFDEYLMDSVTFNDKESDRTNIWHSTPLPGFTIDESKRNLTSHQSNMDESSTLMQTMLEQMKSMQKSMNQMMLDNRELRQEIAELKDEKKCTKPEQSMVQDDFQPRQARGVFTKKPATISDNPRSIVPRPATYAEFPYKSIADLQNPERVSGRISTAKPKAVAFTNDVFTSPEYDNDAVVQNPSQLPSGLNSMIQQKRKLYDLPVFSGRPEDWPVFVTSYEESTAAYNYSPLENTFRLTKALTGEAKRAVESLLIHPRNVEEVLSELKFRFGRPELLVRSQIDKIKDVAFIREQDINSLIEFSTMTKNLVTFLSNAGAHNHLNNPILLDELVMKLPFSRKLQWAEHASVLNEQPTIEDFASWLNKMARLVTYLEYSVGAEMSRQSKAKRVILHTTSNEQNDAKPSCEYCSDPHLLKDCMKFKDMQVDLRWNWAKQNKVCFSCLKFGHHTAACTRKTKCNIDGCQYTHSSLLHNKRKPEEKTPEMNLHTSQSRSSHVWFKIVPVTLYGPKKSVNTFAFLDEGSSVSLIDQKTADEIELSGKMENMCVQWYKGQETNEDCMIVECNIRGATNNCQMQNVRNLRSVKKLHLPRQSIDYDELIAECPEAADIRFSTYEMAAPKILIGLDNSHLMNVRGFITCKSSNMSIVNTSLGWIVSGQSNTNGQDNSTTPRVMFVNDCDTFDSETALKELNSVVKEYFEVENLGLKKPCLENSDVKRARKILSDTTKRIAESEKYETGLLWKENEHSMPYNYDMAFKRQLCLEKKMRKNPDFAGMYRTAMNEYLKKGYARPRSAMELASPSTDCWYLPHCGVINPSKPEKVRVVFDAAASFNGVSLNSRLLKGPDLNQSMMKVLFQFREGKVGVCADIQEMFSQIKIRQQDCPYQLYLWRETEDAPIKEYVMESLIFGATSSPCSAQYVKNINASLFHDAYPEAVKMIHENHYLDDFVASFNTEEEAICVSQQIKHIHAYGGFNLRKFVSNSQNVLRELGETMNETPEIDVNRTEKMLSTEKILGLQWKGSTDEFVFNMKFHKVPLAVLQKQRPPTKREILSMTMSVFDPFGFLSPFTLGAKKIMQETFNLKLDWDQPIPDQLCKKWIVWQDELDSIQKFSIPRCYSLQNEQEKQLHIFVGGAEPAYAAVAYFRIQHGLDVHTAFICGKVKCTPQKPMSVPRIELEAAKIGVRLKKTIIEAHNLQPLKCYYWSDSKIVLSWINLKGNGYNQFVSNRVAEILEESEPEEWNWVPTKLNVADSATRPKFPMHFSSESAWIRGPDFLRLPESAWPKPPTDIAIEIEVERKKRREVILSMKNEISTEILLPDFKRFSSYLRLIRTVAWLNRAIIKWPKIKLSKREHIGELKMIEIDEAEKILFRHVQEQAYPNEIEALRSRLPISKSSSLHSCNPQLDKDGILRVGSRIKAALSVPIDVRHPIILPKNHTVTDLLIDYYHQKCRHQFQETIITEILQRFWIPHLRVQVRKIKRKCQRCKIDTAKPIQPSMGPLPKDRLTPYERPFTFTGLDYFGPLTVTVGRRHEKRWVALFVCLTTHAVHLEIAADLTTDACILCIRNFVNLRGVPKLIRSDNGTNFVGLQKELRNVPEFFDIPKMRRELTTFGIEWKFNAPTDASAGGIWERSVQSVKKVLQKQLKTLAPRVETLRSFLIEAANIVNSRPLTHVPVTPMEPEPLTPNHFLLGGVNSTQTPAVPPSSTTATRKQWRILQQLKDHFWHRWTREYLPTLTRANKWHQNVKPLQEDQLVFICDIDLPRSKWKRGIITKVIRGKDEQVRVVEVRTASGVLRRPANKVAVLDVQPVNTLSEDSLELHGGEDVKNHLS